MNIYFACSITGGRQDEDAYRKIVETLQADGHEVPTASLAHAGVMALEGIVEPRAVYRRDTDWIRACDLLVAEISTPSHGVGYEIAFALSLSKPVICLHRQGVSVSKMLSGNDHPNIRVTAYPALEAIPAILRAMLAAFTGMG